jgi:tripartite ATP-independent transporter DctP family solute receptor
MRQIMLIAGCALLCVGLCLPGTASAGTKADFVIKLGHTATEGAFTSIEGAFSSVFKGIVEAKTGGKVSVEVYPSGQLGGQRELAESAKLGNIEVGFVSDAALSGFVSKAMVFSMPYFFEDTFDPYRLFNSPWGKELNQESIKSANLRILTAGGFGFRSLTNNKRPIRSPADAAGLKIRVMESPVPVAMIKGLGANPTPISITELYTSLQQGVIDGQENPPIVLTTYKLHEVQKYMTLNRHQLGTALVVMNETFYQKLPKAYQAAVDEAADAGAKAWMGLAIIINEGEGLKTVGQKLEIYSPTPAEMSEFKAKMQPMAQKAIAEKVGEEFVKRSMEAVKRLR